MNPFESARTEACSLRAELEKGGVNLDQSGYAFVADACRALDVALKEVAPSHPLLKGCDATILLDRRWVLVRRDVPDDIKAYLVAHELGHLRLHPTYVDSAGVLQSALLAEADTNGAREVEGYGARERQELQANVFARELLLPRRHARMAFIDSRLAASELAHQLHLPLELVRLQLYDAVLLPQVVAPAKHFSLPLHPTEAQRPAVETQARISLIQAGPGTGKTTTLLLRLRCLIAAGVAPESIVILTFSNKAARELVERARAGNIPGADRVWIGTFHAFGLEFLRKFGHLHGLEPRFPVLDKLAALAMLEAEVASFDLKAFDRFANPASWLESAIDTIRRSKDECVDAAGFAAAVAASPAGDPDVDARRGDVAAIFARYEALLAQRKAVDLNDLLGVSIRLMQSGDPDVRQFLSAIGHVMVDEYQDVNRASALLVKEMARAAQTLWVVGDANQAIYAFMGASSTNLDNFQADFPDAVGIPLPVNHRSSQEIIAAFGNVARRNPVGRTSIALQAKRGALGHGPVLIRSDGEQAQLAALARRIATLQANGVPLAEQAVITFKNAATAETAQGLERLGIPVLYLGNVFERPEIKDLICLLQLAIDSQGINLVRQWHSPLLALRRQAADALLAEQDAQERPWHEVDVAGLTDQDIAALEQLRRMCALIDKNMSPWEALSNLLLEDGAWLRQLAMRDGQAAANALMAVWQFVHFCRAPDGTGRWSTVGNLPQRIRDRVRLGEDRSMRAVPPEAEGMNAVRILTAHGSKGLEFDAVHFLDVTKATYETPRQQSSRLLPDTILDSAKAFDTLKNERHNLLYVAVSRPRFYLTVYSLAGDTLPAALDGLLAPCADGGQPPSNAERTVSSPPGPMTTEVSLETYLDYVRCPHGHEMRSRTGRTPREELKLHRVVDLATREVMAQLAKDRSTHHEEKLPGMVATALTHLGLAGHDAVPLIQERILQQVTRGLALLIEGGATGIMVPVAIGPLQVALQPDQVFQEGGIQRLRFIRANGSSAQTMKQPLAALLDAHRAAGRPKMTMEVVTLADGEVMPVGTIKEQTRTKYRQLVQGLVAQRFPATAESRTCHSCAYMFVCSKPASD